MRHRIAAKQFNRDTNHRKMMIRNLVRSLIEHGEIVTTVAKGKETKRWIDRLIGMAQGKDLQARRQIQAFFGRRDVANTLLERVLPLMAKRTAGFSTLTKLGKRRGDNTELVKLSLVALPEVRHTLKSKVERPVKRKKASKAKRANKKSAKKATAVKQQLTQAVAGQKAAKTARQVMPVAQRVQRRLMRSEGGSGK